MSKLTAIILENKSLEELPLALEEGRLPALVSGLGPVQRAHLAAALRIRTNRPVFVLAPDDTAAESMASDISSLLKEDVTVIGAREFTFYKTDTASRQLEQKKLAALYAMHTEKTSVTVGTAACLLQKTVPPEVLDRVCFRLEAGQEIMQEEIIDRLIHGGYSRSDQVEGPGQFALRGSILDIWSAAEEMPTRLDYFGDEIDTIYYFDPSSQRRTEKRQDMFIIPGAESVPDMAAGGRTGLTAKLRTLAAKVNRSAVKFDAEKLRKTMESDAELIETGAEFSAADRYMCHIYPGMCTVAEYIPADALIIMDQPGRCAETAKNYLKQSDDDLKVLIENGTLSARYTEFYRKWDDVLRMLEEFPIVMADTFTVGRYPLQPRMTASVTAKQIPSYAGSSQAAAEDVKRWLAEGYRCILLAGDQRRADAFYDYLRELEIQGVYLDTKNETMPEPGQCAIMLGGLSGGMEYPQLKLAVLSDTQIIRSPRHTKKRRRAVPKGARLGSYEDLSVGDLIVHEVHGIGRFAGIQQMTVEGVKKDYIKISYAGTDCLYVPAVQMDMISKYVGAGENANVRLSKLGGTDWSRTRTRAKAAAREMASELIKLYAARQNSQGHAFAPDSPWQTEFEEAFEYTETEDQLRCIREIKEDMEKSAPMDRLLCGDVGYGKTEVALRAVMKCVLDGCQAAILVPTTVLAQQHFQTASARFFGYPIKIRILSRFTTPAQLKQILAELVSGECDIVIGTHRLLQKDIHFKKLGLLVVDEEQRFGVTHKEHIKEMSKDVDVLTLSATPIPRTLNMALSGIRDLSTLEEPPHERLPVQTFVMEHDWNVIADAIRREITRGGQVYYLHNKIETIEKTAARIAELLPDVTIDVGHGRMNEGEITAVMDRVSQGQTQVLVCTTIIETGIDIPNVNTLIIEDADKMGLSQLHQIRGRVGRSSRRASAYLTYRKDKVLTEIAEKRLEAIREFAEFNAGFRIAMRDLEIRGAGNLLGSQQSGHLVDVGYDMYIKLLEEAVMEEKGETPPVRSECQADITVEANIPESYIRRPEQRMDIYRRIALLRTEEEADDIADELNDRFGDLPPQVNALIQVAIVRGMASNAGIDDITQKGALATLSFTDFDFQRISSVYSSQKWKGRIRVNAGVKPSVTLKLQSRRRTLDDIRAFIHDYTEAKTE